MKASMRPDSMVNQNVASLSSLGNFSKQHINRIIQEAYPLVTTSLMIAFIKNPSLLKDLYFISV